MRGAACVSLAVLATVGVVGSTASAAGLGWHVMPVRHLGRRIGNPQVAAVNRTGTSVVAFASSYSLTLVRRTAHASKFKVAGRISARRPIVMNLTVLADGRFLLVYAARGRLLARGIDAAGRFAGTAHILATFASALGPMLLTWSKEQTGSYDALYYGMAPVVFLLAIAVWLVPVPVRQSP